MKIRPFPLVCNGCSHFVPNILCFGYVRTELEEKINKCWGGGGGGGMPLGHEERAHIVERRSDYGKHGEKTII